MKLNLSVILIAHNDEGNIGKMIEELLAYYSDSIQELIVVYDASRDKTPVIVASWLAKNPKIKLIKRTAPCGVGLALKAGFARLAQDIEYVLTVDSDFVGNVAEVKKLLEAIKENGPDGVIGSRFIHASRFINYPLNKKVMNSIFHYAVRSIFRIRQRDLTNNFKLCKTAILRNFSWRCNGFAINAGIGLLPVIAGFKITEVPVTWTGRDNKMG